MTDTCASDPDRARQGPPNENEAGGSGARAAHAGAAAAATAGAAFQSSLRGLGATLLGMAHTRLELLLLEFEDEKHRLLGLLAWGAVAVVMGGLGLIFLAGWLTLVFWDSHRLLVLAGFAAACTLLAVWAVWRVRALMAAGADGFSASLAELAADRDALAAGAARHHSSPQDLSNAR